MDMKDYKNANYKTDKVEKEMIFFDIPHEIKTILTAAIVQQKKMKWNLIYGLFIPSINLKHFNEPGLYLGQVTSLKQVGTQNQMCPNRDLQEILKIKK